LNKLDQISLRQVRYFIAVSEHGSVNSAANALAISQPAIGMQIRKLEASLGADLLHRSASGVRLTSAGDVFLLHARRIMEAVACAHEALTPANAHGASLTLGVTTTSGRELARPLLEAASRSKELTYRLSFHEGKSDDLLALLRERKIDAALSYIEDRQKPNVVALYDEDFVLVGGPSAIAANELIVTARNISRKRLVVSPAEKGSRKFLELEAGKRGLSFNFNVEMSSISLKQDMLFEHGNCMIVPYGRFIANVRSGQLRMMRFSPPLRRTMGLHFRAGAPALQREFLKNALASCVGQKILEGDLGWSAPA